MKSLLFLLLLLQVVFGDHHTPGAVLATGCTPKIQAYLQCKEMAESLGPNHDALRERRNTCFQPCSGNPDALHPQGADHRPPTELHQCMLGVENQVKRDCQIALKTVINFPDHKGNSPPPPPPHHGMGHPHGMSGHGGLLPPPPFGHQEGQKAWMDTMIGQLCSREVQPTVTICTRNIDNEVNKMMKERNDRMMQCHQEINQNRQCVEMLENAKNQMCECAARKGYDTVIKQQLEQCSTVKPNSPFSLMLRIGQHPPLLGYICSQPPPPPPAPRNTYPGYPHGQVATPYGHQMTLPHGQMTPQGQMTTPHGHQMHAYPHGQMPPPHGQVNPYPYGQMPTHQGQVPTQPGQGQFPPVQYPPPGISTIPGTGQIPQGTFPGQHPSGQGHIHTQQQPAYYPTHGIPDQTGGAARLPVGTRTSRPGIPTARTGLPPHILSPGQKNHPEFIQTRR